VGIAIADGSEPHRCAIAIVPEHALDHEVHAGPPGADAVADARHARQHDVRGEVSCMCAVVVHEAQHDRNRASASALVPDRAPAATPFGAKCPAGTAKRKGQ
jgi:hypothetical protein